MNTVSFKEPVKNYATIPIKPIKPVVPKKKSAIKFNLYPESTVVKVKKDKEEKVDETTVSGSVATATPSGKSSKGGMQFGKGVYESMDSKVENMIEEKKYEEDALLTHTFRCKPIPSEVLQPKYHQII